MKFLIFKALFMLLVLLLLGYPFLPCKLRFTLISDRYEKKNTWKNIAFVLETMLLGAMLLSLAPVLKSWLTWFFHLGFMQWILDKVSARTTYTLSAIVILVLNISLLSLFMIAKKISRFLLDKYVFKDTAQKKDKKDSGKNRKKEKNNARYRQKNQAVQQKDLKKLRKESVLVFDRAKNTARVEKVVSSDFKEEKQSEKKSCDQEANDEELSFAQLLKRYWFAFIGIFYDKEEEYAYAKPGTYRWEIGRAHV